MICQYSSGHIYVTWSGGFTDIWFQSSCWNANIVITLCQHVLVYSCIDEHIQTRTHMPTYTQPPTPNTRTHTHIRIYTRNHRLRTRAHMRTYTRNHRPRTRAHMRTYTRNHRPRTHTCARAHTHPTSDPEHAHTRTHTHTHTHTHTLTHTHTQTHTHTHTHTHMRTYTVFFPLRNVSGNYPCATRPRACAEVSVCVDLAGNKSRCEEPFGE